MADVVNSQEQREFRCTHCDGKIKIPRNLPSTTGPCPHCSGVITSPAPEPEPIEAAQLPSLPPAAASPPPAPAVPAELPPAVPAAAVPPSVPPVIDTPGPPPSPAGPPLGEMGPPPAPGKQEVPKAEIPASRGAPVETKPVEQKPAEPEKTSKRKTAKRERSGLIPMMLVLLVVGLVGYAVVHYAAQELSKSITPPVADRSPGDTEIDETNYIRIGWQKDAYKVLNDYLLATSSEEKVPFVINGDQLAATIEDFYGGSVINDSDTPAEGFSVFELPEEDRRRGIFMMIYDLPPQFDMKEFFRPLASLEVQYGIDEADLLLSTLSRVGNFATDPLKVHAFFKRTPQGLKLDWEIFAQTKYRTFLNFVELPEIGQTGVFRVFIEEDVPDKGKTVAGTRTYRIMDPANSSDSARVNVDVDSEIGRELSVINWRDTKESKPITKTATLELIWNGEPDAPVLAINRFICWEFLGLGGEKPRETASKN